jgi:hypothetical protein
MSSNFQKLSGSTNMGMGRFVELDTGRVTAGGCGGEEKGGGGKAGAGRG